MMEPVSAGYNPYSDVRHVDFKITFGVIAPEAAAQASPASSAQEPVSQISQTHDGTETMSQKLGTLEDGLFLLDGTYCPPPKNAAGLQTGWLSQAMSGKDMTFQENPWIEFSFAKSHRSYAFTLIFDDTMPDEYPAEIIAVSYDKNGDVIGSATSFPSACRHVIHLPTNGYRKVRFEFVRTNKPFRRIRLCEAVFGIRYQYDKNSISSGSLDFSSSPIAESIPSNELEVTVDNASKLYNMINPDGLFAYLQDGQFAECGIAVNGETVNMGRFYFTSAKSDDGGLTARITFNDRIYMLDNTTFSGDTSGTWTLAEAVDAVLQAAGLEIPTNYEEGLAQTVIKKCIPQNTKNREALRLACQAAMCTCRIARNHALFFFRPNAEAPVLDRITRDVQLGDAQIKVTQAYNVVELTVRDNGGEEVVYTAKEVPEDEMELVYQVNNPLVHDGDAVAQWILSWMQRRITYAADYRCSPALDACDIVRIYDVYGVNGAAMLTEMGLSFDGGLSAAIKAIGTAVPLAVYGCGIKYGTVEYGTGGVKKHAV